MHKEGALVACCCCCVVTSLFGLVLLFKTCLAVVACVFAEKDLKCKHHSINAHAVTHSWRQRIWLSLTHSRTANHLWGLSLHLHQIPALVAAPSRSFSGDQCCTSEVDLCLCVSARRPSLRLAIWVRLLRWVLRSLVWSFLIFFFLSFICFAETWTNCVLLVCLCQLITAARWARRPLPTAPLPLTTTDTWVRKKTIKKVNKP